MSGIAFRGAWRRLLRAKAFTAFCVIVIGLTVGLVATVYATTRAILTPPDLPDLPRLVDLHHRRMPSDAFSRHDVQFLREHQKVFSDLAAWAPFRHVFEYAGNAEFVIGEAVDLTYFSLAGVRPALGRLFGIGDYSAAAQPAAILSHQMWSTRFQRDPHVVGRLVRIGGLTCEIVGVLPAAFRGLHLPTLSRTHVWVPLSLYEQVNPIVPLVEADHGSVRLRAKLNAGATVEEAAEQLQVLAALLDSRDSSASIRRFEVRRTQDAYLGKFIDRVAVPVGVAAVGMSVLFLLIGCTNLAAFRTANTLSRYGEIGIRGALGASRSRLVREEIAGDVIIAVAGGATAAVVVVGLLRLLRLPLYVENGFAVQADPQITLGVILVGVASSFAALVIAGLTPALLATGRQQAFALRSAQATTIRTSTARSLVLFVQITAATAMLGVALILQAEARALRSRDVGMDLDRIAVAVLDLEFQKLSEASGRAVVRQLQDRLSDIPGLESGAISSGLPVGVSTPGAGVAMAGADGFSPRHDVELLAAAGDVFRTLGVSIESGRPFDERDQSASEPVAVISRLVAQRTFGAADPIGRMLVLQKRRWVGQRHPEPKEFRVIGIASDVDAGRIGQRAHGVVYVPLGQQYEGRLSILARTSRDPGRTADALRALVGKTRPDIAVLEAGPATVLGGARPPALEFGVALVGSFGLLAAAICLIGVGGGIAQFVVSRRRETALRLALGATPQQIVRNVVWIGLRPVLAAILAGSALALFIRGAMRPFFLNPLAPSFPTLAPALVVLAGVAFLVILPSAVRAASRPPLDALKTL